MSKQNCFIYTDGNGNYCCRDLVMCVDDCAVTLHTANIAANILVYPSGDVDDGAVVYAPAPANGTITIAEPGKYGLSLDCEALDGTPAPVEGAMLACYEVNCVNGLLELQILESLQALCDKIGALEGVDLTAICEKLEALIAILSAADFAELCGKLLGIVAALEALCEKIEAQGDEMCDKLDAIAAAIAALDANLAAILTAINTGNASLEKICDKLDALLAAIVAMQAAIIAELGVAIGILNTIAAALNNMEDKLCDIAETVIDAPECAGDVTGGDGGTPVGDPHTYPGNFSNQTFFSIQPGNNFVIDNGPVTELPAVAYLDAINACIAAGHHALVTFNGPQGSATGTFTTAVSNTQNSSTPLTNVSGTVPIKVTSGVVQCVTADSPPQPAEGKCMSVYDKCATFCLKQIKEVLVAAQNCTKPLAMKLSGVTTTQCCTGGSIPGVTDRCISIPTVWLVGDQENCTYTINGVDMGEAYTQEEFMATFPAGTIIGETTADDVTVYTSVTGVCFQRFCRVTGELVGQLTRVCKTSIPNTSVAQCKDYLDVLDKHSEPTADILYGIGEDMSALLEKQCDANEMASDALIKQCLLDDFWMNCVEPGEPIVPVPPINEEAVTTVTLKGDQTADYPEGATVALYDAQGNIIGSGTVQSAAVNEEGNTVVTLADAEMSGTATTAQIATVKPVLQQTVGAVKAVVKGVSILQAKRSLASATSGKKETITRG